MCSSSPGGLHLEPTAFEETADPPVVLTARCGDTAVQHLKRLREHGRTPDLVLFDLHLPARQRIATHRRAGCEPYAAVPCAVMSSVLLPPAVHDALASRSVATVLVKPSTDDGFADWIGRALRLMAAALMASAGAVLQVCSSEDEPIAAA